MTTEIAQSPNKTPIAATERGLQLTTLDDMYRFAQYVVASSLCPKDCKNPADALIRLQAGAELGYGPFQSLQNVANINGRGSVWGHGAMALLLRSGLVDDWAEKEIGTRDKDGKPTDSWGIEITAKRKGVPSPVTRRFTVRDSKTAGIWGVNVWKTYPEDMLRWKVVARISKALFADVLNGLEIREDIQDVIDVTPKPVNLNPRSLDALEEQIAPVEPEPPVAENATSEPDRDYPDADDLRNQAVGLQKSKKIKLDDFDGLCESVGIIDMAAATVDQLEALLDKLREVK